jgi:hypothetical protein
MADELIDQLRGEFRRHLESFYAALKLAPPYHSVEKAIAQLSATLSALDAADRARLAQDPSAQWDVFARAFTESGLHQKHRGPISHLLRSGQVHDLAPEYEHFLNAYRS